MGTLARSVFDAGGEVTAIITTAKRGSTEVRWAASADRRSRMPSFASGRWYEASDAVLVLPGGVETLRNFVDRLVQVSTDPTSQNR